MQQFREIINTNFQFKELNLNKSSKDSFVHNLKNNWAAYVDIPNLNEDDYINLLQKLWKFKKETDSKIMEYFYKWILLNIITNKWENTNNTYQPFSTKSLNIHIENSLNPIDKIPNYLTLYCKKYSPEIRWGDTLIISMSDILNEFKEKELDILRTSKIKLNNWIELPNNILVEDKKRKLEFLAFRDFWDYEKDWFIINSSETKKEIKKVIYKLYELLYSKENLKKIPWKVWSLYWIDNKKFLHLRTKQFESWERHLQRLRII